MRRTRHEPPRSAQRHRDGPELSGRVRSHVLSVEVLDNRRDHEDHERGEAEVDHVPEEGRCLVHAATHTFTGSLPSRIRATHSTGWRGSGCALRMRSRSGVLRGVI